MSDDQHEHKYCSFIAGEQENLELQIWDFIVKGGETEQITMLNFSTLFLQRIHQDSFWFFF